MADYTSLAAVKEALQIFDTSQDALILTKIAAAEQQINDHCGRVFTLDDTPVARVINTRRRTWRDDDGDHLVVPDIGSATLTVEAGTPGGTSWTDITAQVEAEPVDAIDDDRPVTSLLLIGHRRWPARARITTRWGWPAIPAMVPEASTIQTIRLYKRKDSPEGVLGTTEWGGPVRMSRIDPDVQALLQNIVLPGVG